MTEPQGTTIERQVLELCRGCEALYTQQELGHRLAEAAASGRQLRIKLGLDPTAPDIHLGHTVVLGKMRQFQDLGHKAVVIIGDYTARVGDPSGVNRTRPVLSPQEIDANAETYFQQAGKVLDTSAEKLEIRKNSEWLASLRLADVLKLAAQMTVARMMERDTFELRYHDGVPIGVHEFLYPLMQGYDSVCIQADVELGGTDQTFNNLVGRQLQAHAGQKPQIVMIMPILVGLDGTEKMSKSKGNYIGVTDEPNDMFGKVMSIPDALMDNYFTLLTDLPPAEIDLLLNADRTHPRDAKARLGRMIVERYHGREAAEAAAAEFDRVFKERKLPTDIPEFHFPEGTIAVSDMIVQMGFVESKSEARRQIEQGAVKIENNKLTDIHFDVTISDATDGWVVRVGKRQFGRIRKSP
jgi:tyrosyl-tRNA synthetase